MVFYQPEPRHPLTEVVTEVMEVDEMKIKIMQSEKKQMVKERNWQCLSGGLS
jgi:hypothetical protein